MKNQHTNRPAKTGFTLIELLAVIAIIGILASIVVPNVSRYIAKSQITKAVAEIKNAETALTGMLSDTGRSNFKDFLRNNQNGRGLRQLRTLHNNIVPEDGGTLSLQATADGIQAALDFYNEMFYELLRQGSDSEWVLANIDPQVRTKLGTTYLNLGNDSWGNPYQFWLGAIPRGFRTTVLRSYRVDPGSPSPNDPEFTSEHAYKWDDPTRTNAQRELPGQPRNDSEFFVTDFGERAYGYPAPKDLPVYIFSKGPNLVIDALLHIQLAENIDFPEFYGGGDDPNSWDNASGWDDAPK